MCSPSIWRSMRSRRGERMTISLALILAAVLEIGGDAAIRRGLTRSPWPWLALGGASLLAYGFAVNLNRVIAFGHLMGLYIVVFFVVSQLLAFLYFGETPSAAL